jgi:hypothetical protein
MQINSDLTLRHKIEHINLLLTNQSGGASLPSSPNIYSKPSNFAPNDNKDSQDDSDDSIDKVKDVKLDSSELASSPNLIDTLNSSQNHQSSINYDKIEILLIDLKKYIANSAHNWNTKMSEFFKKNKYDDVGVISTGTSENSSSNPIDIPAGNFQIFLL